MTMQDGILTSNNSRSRHGAAYATEQNQRKGRSRRQSEQASSSAAFPEPQTSSCEQASLRFSRRGTSAATTTLVIAARLLLPHLLLPHLAHAHIGTRFSAHHTHTHSVLPPGRAAPPTDDDD